MTLQFQRVFTYLFGIPVKLCMDDTGIPETITLMLKKLVEKISDPVAIERSRVWIKKK